MSFCASLIGVSPRSTALILALCASLATGCPPDAPAEAPTRVVAAEPPKSAEPEPMSAQALMAHVEYLASPELEGRLAGSAGERRAAEYIAERLEQLDLPPAGPRRSQVFSLAGVRGAGGDSSRNVLALLEATSPEAREEYVVIGAHYDHEGIVRGELYPGAEDNASGVAVVLEIARALRARRHELRRSIVFAFFGAEEIGLYGSRAFVRESPVPVDRIAAMVNLDMIGRPLMDHPGLALPKMAMGVRSHDSVGAIGTRTRPRLRALVAGACEEQDLTVYGPEEFSEPLASIIEALAKNRADHSSFEEAGIPAVFFSAGESEDYHRPTDVPDALDPDLMRRRALAIATTVIELSKAPWADIRASTPELSTGARQPAEH